MSKLIAAYLANPSKKNAIKLARYEAKHMMAACLLSAEEGVTLNAALAHAKGG